MKSKYYHYRIAARILGGVASVFYFYVAFKSGLVQVMQGLGDNQVPFFPFFAIAVTGYIISYVQERRGGYFVLAGGTGLFLFFIVYHGGFDWARAAAFGLPFILSGAALVYCNQKE